MDDMDEFRIGFLVKIVSDRLRIRGDAELKRFGLTFTQSRVLALLAHVPEGQATQKELEVSLAVAHPTIVGILRRMERDGFVKTWQDPEDRRNKIVKLTDEAYAVYDKMCGSIQEGEQQMLRSLSEQQVRELTDLLKVLYRNLGGNPDKTTL